MRYPPSEKLGVIQAKGYMRGPRELVGQVTNGQLNRHTHRVGDSSKSILSNLHDWILRYP